MEVTRDEHVTAGWAVRFPREHVEAVGRLWNVPRVEVCEHDGMVWLRGNDLNAEVDVILRGFLSGKRFLVLPDGQVQSPRDYLPLGYLPPGPWIELRDWLRISSPPAALAGRIIRPAPLTLIHTTTMMEPEVLLTHIKHWLPFGTNAPDVRLRRLRFAQDGLGRVVVWGKPLPAIPGEQYCVEGWIAVAAGCWWSPPVNAAVVAECLGLRTGDLALIGRDGTWEHVRANHFVAATRQAIRTSAAQRDD